MEKAKIRLRISESEVHYAGRLVDGARVIGLFGDLATELLIRHDGDEGLFVAYDFIEFKAPVYGGDYLEVTGWIDRVGNTSRHMQFEAYKVITGANLEHCPSAFDVLPEPILVARAGGTCVVAKERRRGGFNNR